MVGILLLLLASPPTRAQQVRYSSVVVHMLRGGEQARGDGFDVLNLGLAYNEEYEGPVYAKETGTAFA